MSASLEKALAYVEEHDARFVEEIAAWCRIPSVSSQAEYKPDMHRAAEWTADRLRRAGLRNVAILPTAGHPVVYGDWLAAGRGKPTVLVYGHYDVQPALDPSVWQSPPFGPQQRGEHLFARGAADMKGQTIAAIAAVEAHVQAGGRLPVNVKFLIEGEEEVSSRSLREFIRGHRERLARDYSLNNDAEMPTPEHPATALSLRGMARVDLAVFGPASDVHSGAYGGVLHNPAQALCELIAGMHDQQGRITLPAFYDRVRTLDAEERAELSRVPRDDEQFLKATGAPALWGEPEFTPYERTTIRPTLEVLSIHAGLSGDGVLNVVPARATARLSMRLVPDQDPRECYQSLLRYLEAQATADIRWEAKYISGRRATLMDRNSPGIRAAQRALQATWGVPPLFMRSGGGIGAVSMLEDEMGVSTVLCGFILPDSGIHGPNEHLHLPTWRRGVEALTRFFVEAAADRAGEAA